MRVYRHDRGTGTVIGTYITGHLWVRWDNPIRSMFCGPGESEGWLPYLLVRV